MATAGYRAATRPRLVTAVVTGLIATLGGCAGHAGGRAGTVGLAETAAPLLLPDLPPEVELLGMEQDTLQDLLGEPALQRAEQQAAYWRYSLGRCQLDIFLYPDPKTGEAEVTYFEVRPTGYQVADRQAACAGVAEQLEHGGGDRLPVVQSH